MANKNIELKIVVNGELKEVTKKLCKKIKLEDIVSLEEIEQSLQILKDKDKRKHTIKVIKE